MSQVYETFSRMYINGNPLHAEIRTIYNPPFIQVECLDCNQKHIDGKEYWINDVFSHLSFNVFDYEIKRFERIKKKGRMQYITTEQDTTVRDKPKYRYTFQIV